MQASHSTHPQYIAYYRVSTKGQAESGLGLDGQRTSIHAYAGEGNLIAEYEEHESGRKTDRPQLAAALRHCKATGATLIIAKLDRLARNTLFLLQLMQSGVEILALDCPSMNKLTLTVFAAVAEQEADLISQRTKAALAAAKARGVKLGGFRPEQQARRNEWEDRRRENSTAAHKSKADAYAMTVGTFVRQAQHSGLSLQGIADSLTAQNIRTARGGQWTRTAVKNLIARLDALGV